MEADLETLAQKIEWLDQERRKDRTTVVALQERFTALEGELRAVRAEVKDLADEIARLSALLAKVDAVEARLAEHERKSANEREGLSKQLQSRIVEEAATWQHEVQILQERLAILERESVKPEALEQAIARVEESLTGLRKALAEIEKRGHDVDEVREEVQRVARLLQEAQERESRRINDLQGEVSALRKRAEERAGQIQLLREGLQKVENRLNELSAAEIARTQQQREFIETQSRQMLDWGRTWKQWEQRFAEVEALSQQVSGYLESWEETLRNLRAAEKRFAEMTERLERRIHEITEMQRLAEDRFRQEWNAFKADDQKRWANYTLSQEERGRELDRRLGKLKEDLDRLQESTQGLQDFLQMSDEQARKRLQALAAMAQEWLQEYERTLGMMRLP